MKLAGKIESILFWKAEPISIKRLSVLLGENEEAVKASLDELDVMLKERGIRLIRKDDGVAIGTAPEASSLIEKLSKEEFSRDIGKAGLETLSIILFYGPIARRDIDYIRGVNSTFIIRNLLIRGLVERLEDERDQRVFLYKPTFDLLMHLGISKVEDLPDYHSVREEFNSFVANKEKVGEESEVTQKFPSSK